jgi:hypothetical protein
VEGVDHRVAARLLLGIARWQEHDRVTIDGVSLEVALEGRPVDLDKLRRDGLAPGTSSGVSVSTCASRGEARATLVASIASMGGFVVVVDIFSPPVRNCVVAMRARAEWHTGEE